MARSEARIPNSIWSDPDFRSLSVGAQWLYFFLVSQPDCTHLGLIVLRVRRWVSYASGLTETRLLTDLDELQRAGIVIADDVSEELLALPLIRHSGIVGQPSVLRAAQKEVATIHSEALRAALAEELKRLMGITVRMDSHAILTAMLRTLGINATEGSAASQDSRVAKRRSATARVRLAVYERDGFACAECGWSLPPPENYSGLDALAVLEDRGRAGVALRALQLDHVYPRSKGGAFSLENLQTLCTICNSRKGARVLIAT